MATIPPLAVTRPAVPRASLADSWVTFNLFFALAVSGLLNILLIVRLATLR